MISQQGFSVSTETYYLEAENNSNISVQYSSNNDVNVNGFNLIVSFRWYPQCSLLPHISTTSCRDINSLGWGLVGRHVGTHCQCVDISDGCG